jgi:DNA-binding response OmpR family regulator
MTDTIVVADDSPTILSLVVLSLRRDGHEPVTATDGASALAAIRECRPRLVILDAMMPNGDGYDVCRALQQDEEHDAHVIMLTASAREVDRDRAREVGVHEFITKPFSPAELRRRVQEVLAAA